MANSIAVIRANPKVLTCTCKHDFQDARYGKNKRVANPTMKGANKEGPAQYRCTVCSALLAG